MTPRRSITARLCTAALSGAIAISPLTSSAAFAGTPVIGLSGEDAPKASQITTALRKAMADRGEADDTEMTLEELELTMGCESGDTACIAGAGESMGASQLVIGSVADAGGGAFDVSLKLVDVGAGSVSASFKKSVDASVLEGEALDEFAKSALGELFGDPPEVEEPEPTPEETVPEADEKKSNPKGKLVAGAKDNPKWEWIGFGVSGGLMLASLGTAIGTTVAIGENGPVRRDLVDEAEASLTDDNPANNVDPNTSEDLCVLAREETMPGRVRNASMTEVCNKADALATTATATWVATGVLAVPTIIFGVLVFTHREKVEDESTAMGKMRKHQVNFGVAPNGDGGVVTAAGFKF